MRSSRAARTRSELDALAVGDRSGGQLADAVCAALQHALPFEFGCLATTDPATGLITSAYKTEERVDTKDHEFVRYEYEVDDINLFSDIVRRPTPVGILQEDSGGHPERSARYREFLVPEFDHGHELRAALRSGGRTWGCVSLMRPVGGSGFTGEDAAFVAQVGPTIAEALRAQAVRVAAQDGAEDGAPGGPAVIVLDARDATVSATPAVEPLLADVRGPARHGLPIALLAVSGAVRARAAREDAPPPRATLRTASGRWLVVQGAPLGAADDVVLTLEEAGPPDIVPIVVAALGLTAREQELTGLVLAGLDTAAIAARLHLSPYTVQDHLKSIFAKAGVRSRRELIASVFYEHYAPRFGQAVGTSGWFAGP
jgi:DNA-binding CsgD family transcriptional regulator